jgi:hypothetical protein
MLGGTAVPTGTLYSRSEVVVPKICWRETRGFTCHLNFSAASGTNIASRRKGTGA